MDGSIDHDVIMPWHNMPEMPSPEHRILPDNEYYNNLTFIQVQEELNELILNANKSIQYYLRTIITI